ncbi:hypothetical protein [Cohnella abietis]|uniref:Uncharacterized protein n=1 Tax=Cohnella abietis TaxID=2507935 RepID=A0A3T1CY32_9BACL|nr:hypothetical protein [Cohnella abietis]BBI30740.1 hypothetical protein KCTCHS21_01390 [Cohnella abietis]
MIDLSNYEPNITKQLTGNNYSEISEELKENNYFLDFLDQEEICLRGNKLDKNKIKEVCTSNIRVIDYDKLYTDIGIKVEYNIMVSKGSNYYLRIVVFGTYQAFIAWNKSQYATNGLTIEEIRKVFEKWDFQPRSRPRFYEIFEKNPKLAGKIKDLVHNDGYRIGKSTWYVTKQKLIEYLSTQYPSFNIAFGQLTALELLLENCNDEKITSTINSLRQNFYDTFDEAMKGRPMPRS